MDTILFNEKQTANISLCLPSHYCHVLLTFSSSPASPFLPVLQLCLSSQGPASREKEYMLHAVSEKNTRLQITSKTKQVSQFFFFAAGSCTFRPFQGGNCLVWAETVLPMSRCLVVPAQAISAVGAPPVGGCVVNQLFFLVSSKHIRKTSGVGLCFNIEPCFPFLQRVPAHALCVFGFGS